MRSRSTGVYRQQGSSPSGESWQLLTMCPPSGLSLQICKARGWGESRVSQRGLVNHARPQPVPVDVAAGAGPPPSSPCMALVCPQQSCTVTGTCVGHKANAFTHRPFKDQVCEPWTGDSRRLSTSARGTVMLVPKFPHLLPSPCLWPVCFKTCLYQIPMQKLPCRLCEGK